ncbi:Di-copper centre-containing protein [Xylariomycetidae sp. FL0641]|nr:Di-copper centre-containing protein [Xylariomycetidae sp. FL0641]
MTIHGTGNFLTWHRYFTWAYEQALRNECGYNGYQPYWNWFANTDDLEKSPVFDGSETSMSGNGAKIDFNGTLVSKGKVWVPPGSGGGCVTSGPFKDYTVNLGPVSPTQDGMVAVNDSLSYNPHCMQRDLSSFVATGWLTTENLLNITVGAASGSISAFQNELQGRFQDGFLGLHTAGHDVMGGTSADLSASPSDPVFFLHHSMLDRVYWIWQALHPFQAKDIAGTRSILGTGPDALKSDVQDLGTLAEPKTISQLIDTLEGPFCYVYA